MANKIEIDKLESISANDAAAVASINRNFEKVQAAINNSLSRDGTVPNFMDADLDLNTHRIINGAAPVDDGDFVTLEYFKENVGESANNAAAAEQAALRAASSAQSASISANNALSSANAAATSAQQAANTASGFDTHYAEKVQEFDNNAQQKVDDYNSNATVKTSAFDTNAQQKLNSFNQNAAEKQAAVDASAAAAKQSEDNAADSAEKAKQYATKTSFGNIGDIKYTTRTDVPNGGAWCDGAEYTQAMFPDIYQMLVDGKISSTDFSTFDSTVSANGSCGLFALDTATQKFKVPMLKDVYIKAGQAPSMFGAESLPNIKGYASIGVTGVGGSVKSANGVFSKGSNDNYIVSGGNKPNESSWDFYFNASNSSSVYQDGAKVNPDHVVYRAYVVLYASAAEASVAQAQEFINALSNKANTVLDNVTPAQSFKDMSIKWGLPDYGAGVSVDFPITGSGAVKAFTASFSGRLIVSQSSANNWCYIFKNQNRTGIIDSFRQISTVGGFDSVVVDLEKGQTIYYEMPQSAKEATLYPFKGVNNA